MDYLFVRSVTVSVVLRGTLRTSYSFKQENGMLFLLQLPIMLELAPPCDHLRIFPPVKLHFCFWCMRISQNLETLLQIYISIFLSILRLVLLPNLSSSVLSPVNCGWLTFQERENLICNEQSVNTEIGSVFFLKMLVGFF